MTNEELDGLVARARDLAPVVGLSMDDIADAITAMRAERDELRAAIFGSADYSEMLRNGNFVEMARDMEAGRKGAIARAEAAEALVEELETDMGKVILNLPPAKGIRAAGPVEGVKMLRDAHETVSRRALAAEAAALERAALAVANVEIGWHDGISGDYHCKSGPAILSNSCSAIRALITPEGRTALDDALADARRAGKLEGLRDAAKLCEDQAAQITEQKVELSDSAVSIGDQWQVERFRVTAQQCEILAAILRISAEALAARVEGGGE